MTGRVRIPGAILLMSWASGDEQVHENAGWQGCEALWIQFKVSIPKIST